MAFTTELTENYMGIIHVGSGVVTGTEILEGCKSVTALVRVTENFQYKLIDFSAVTDLRITAEELDEIVKQDRLIASSRPNATVVIVAPDDHIRAIAQHWEILVEDLGWNTRVSRTRAEASDWLKENSIAASLDG
ncbi:MAG: hypothetical protein ACREIF_13405 [Chthoniobacterales bacterium]